MKKRICLFIVVLAMVFTGGCASTSKTIDRDLQTESEFFYFRIVESGQMTDGGDYYVIVDDNTGVLYLYVFNGFGAAITPLINADGTPKLLSGFDIN